MKHIYIVLIKAHTGLGKFARFFGGYEYTHIALCLDKSLTDFISYSRKKHYLPFDAGFAHEYRDYYAFGKHRSFKAKVFAIPVKRDNYNNILNFISECENDKQQMFNLFSMATMPILHGFEIYKAHNCMTFTAKAIQLSSAVKMKKPYYKYSIKDIDELLSDHAVFEGKICRKTSPNYAQYMQKPSVAEYICAFSHIVLTLIKRMIFTTPPKSKE